MINIGELVHLPPVRTVVRLADLADQSLRRHMAETFIFTGEVSFVCSTILKKISATQGEGFFIVGNYGSGKSHLLNVLSLILSDAAARDTFARACREGAAGDAGLASLLERAAAVNPLVVEISLVEHSSRQYLEQIILARVEDKLRKHPGAAELPEGWRDMPRPEAFGTLCRSLSGAGWGGLVLLIDELSEFLRSKENARAYNEDIRFLQYLGEFAENIPAWIAATMQENLENTGSLSEDMLHKIKDRYPVRFQLSGEHVKEIVSKRLVQKKKQAEKALPQVFNELELAFGRLPFSRREFDDLYPVHPGTVELLDELRPLFSQHRGVIDFIHYRLAGDPGRAIPAFLDQPASSLLTPDYIFDHFRDRLRETVETSPYSEQIYRHYEREAGKIFPDEEDARTALRLLKLLILGALARAPKGFTAEELARLLLYRFSSLESGVNYDYIAEIMDRFMAHGAYIVATENGAGTKVYTVDLKADVALLLNKKLSHLAGMLDPADPRIVESLLPWADEPYLPLKELQQEPLQENEIIWQNTKRTGKILFNIPADQVAELLQEWPEQPAGQETDFIFFVAVPPRPGRVDQILPEEALAHYCDPDLLKAMALWAPREITPVEEEQLRRAYIHLLLHEEYAADTSPVGLQINRQLEGLLAEERRAVKQIFRDCYFQGKLKAARQVISPVSLGYLPLGSMITRVASEILKERFPRHCEIRPQGEQITGSLMQRTLDLLISPRLEEEGLERGIKQVVENYLKPMGLVKKKGQGYLLEINPKTSPLIGEFLALIPETGRIPLERLYRQLRKSPFGLSAEGFRTLGTAVILSGAVSAYQGGKRLAPSQASYYRFWNIDAVGPGSLIRPELQNVLTSVPFIPSRLRSAALTFTSQQQIWEAVISFKDEWRGKGAEIRSRLERLKGHRLFIAVGWDKLEKALDRMDEFLDEIKVSYASQEGLERFLAAYQSRPLVPADSIRLAAIYDFLQGDLPDILRLGHYLQDLHPAVPEKEKYGVLTRRFKLLLDLLGEEALLWEEPYRDRLKREFTHFLNEYTALYLEEHQREVGPERLKPYHALMETKAYRLLEQLGRINAVIVKEDLVSINRQLARPLERECRAAEDLLLRERPLCSCGFVLGETVILPAVRGLEDQILQGVEAYVRALQAAGSREKIDAYAEHLVLVGRRREAEPLQSLLKIPAEETGAALLSRLSEMISQNVIAHINRALTGEAMISERAAEELLELLADRVFTAEQLRGLFQAWLAGGDDNLPHYIRVTGLRRRIGGVGGGDLKPGRALPEPGQDPRLYLEEKFPRLLSLAARIGESGVYMSALTAGWLKFHNLAAESAADQGTNGGLDLLVKEILEPEAAGTWSEHKGDLAALGERVMMDRETLPVSFLERIAAETTVRLPAEQLLESCACFRLNLNQPFRFDSLLDMLVDEPYFPALSRVLAGKIAVQISSEELPSNLTVMAGTLKEARRALDKTGAALTRSHLEEKGKILAVLHALARCNLLLHDLERVAQDSPDDDKGWEKLYHRMAPVELLLSGLEDVQARTLVLETTVKRWRRRYASLLDLLLERFAQYCLNPAHARRQTLPALFRQFNGWAAKDAPGQGAYLVILDGARLDLWGVLLEWIMGECSLELLREGLTWAAQPTITAAQLQPLKEEGLLGHILHMDDRLVSELISDPQIFLQAVNNFMVNSRQETMFKAMKFDFIDEKIHASRDPLPVLLEEVLLQSRKKLRPLLNSISSGSLILVVSDHGFKTNLCFDKANKDEVLYLHGSSSFFETLAPWALLRKR